MESKKGYTILLFNNLLNYFFSPVGEAGEYVVGWQGRPVLFKFYFDHCLFTQIFDRCYNND